MMKEIVLLHPKIISTKTGEYLRIELLDLLHAFTDKKGTHYPRINPNEIIGYKISDIQFDDDGETILYLEK